MLKIRGVNVFPSQIEEVLINTEGIGPNYEIVVDRKNHSDILIIKVEVEAESMMDSYACLLYTSAQVLWVCSRIQVFQNPL